MAMDSDIMAIMDLGTTDMARGLLMLSLRPRLILTTDTDMVWDTDVDTTVAISDTPDTLATDLDMDMAIDMDTMVAISDTPDSDTVCTESKQTNSWNL